MTVNDCDSLGMTNALKQINVIKTTTYKQFYGVSVSFSNKRSIGSCQQTDR